MEKIGDKDTAIAERVRALLAAANSSSAAAAVPPGAPAVPVPSPSPGGVRRLDPSTDPATVVANLTVAGIRYAVSRFLFIASVQKWLCFLSSKFEKQFCNLAILVPIFCKSRAKTKNWF
jgi:hypothetical protein